MGCVVRGRRQVKPEGITPNSLTVQSVFSHHHNHVQLVRFIFARFTLDLEYLALTGVGKNTSQEFNLLAAYRSRSVVATDFASSCLLILLAPAKSQFQ